MKWFRLKFMPNGKVRLVYVKWHPKAWLDIYFTLRSQGSGILESVYYTVRFLTLA